MKPIKMLKILETVWLIIGSIGLILFIYSLIYGNKEQAIYFIAFSAISVLMFYLRRRQRRSYEKRAEKAEKQA